MTTAKDINIRKELVERVSAEILEGVEIGDAAKNAAQWIIDEDLAIDFVKDLGPNVIAGYWRVSESAKRTNAFDEQGERRVNLGALADDGLGSPYALMWNVPDVGYFSMGNLTKVHCTSIAKAFDKRSTHMASHRDCFTEIADMLKGVKMVKDSIKEDDLWTLMRRYNVKADDKP